MTYSLEQMIWFFFLVSIFMCVLFCMGPMCPNKLMNWIELNWIEPQTIFWWHKLPFHYYQCTPRANINLFTKFANITDDTHVFHRDRVCLFCSWGSIYALMTSSNGNIFRVTGLLCGEFTDHRCIPHTKASDAELWCFLWSTPEPTVEQIIETPVVWGSIVLIITSL